MKKLILLIGLVVAFLFTGCDEDTSTVFGRRGLLLVAEKGAIVVEKTGCETFDGDVPMFILDISGDTISWVRVPVNIYNKHNPGDTIKPL